MTGLFAKVSTNVCSKASAVVISQEFADKIGSKLRNEIGNLLVLEELLQEEPISQEMQYDLSIKHGRRNIFGHTEFSKQSLNSERMR